MSATPHGAILCVRVDSCITRSRTPVKHERHHHFQSSDRSAAWARIAIIKGASAANPRLVGRRPMTTNASSTPMAPTISGQSTRRVILLAFGLQATQTVALAATTIVTGASVLVAQTFVATADLAVQVFLVVGVRTSASSRRDASDRLRARALLLVVVRGPRDLRERLHGHDRRSVPRGAASHGRDVVRRRVCRSCGRRHTRRRRVHVRAAGDEATGSSTTALHHPIPSADDGAGDGDGADREIRSQSPAAYSRWSGSRSRNSFIPQFPTRSPAD